MYLLDETGDHSFSFYFKGSSALKISRRDVKSRFDLRLGNSLLLLLFRRIKKISHHLFIKKQRSCGVLICFDVNLDLIFGKTKSIFRKQLRFLPYIDVIKVADNELEF